MIDEKRAAGRWEPPEGSKVVLMCNGFREEARILDVSNSGMRAKFTKPFGVGCEIYAKVTIVASESPYYVLGEIKRIKEEAGSWEASIQFSNVKQEPIRKDIVF